MIDKSILEKINSLPTPKIIGVSGFGGSGKSTFAKALGAALSAPVIGVDSFQKKGAFDTEFSLWEIMDYSRLEEEVFEPFFRQEDIHYGHFDASKEIISHSVEVKNTGTLVVEEVLKEIASL